MAINRRVTVKRTYPVTVSYTCSYCGEKNEDVPGTVVLTASSGTYGHTEAYARAGVDVQEQKLLAEYMSGQYKGKGLVCCCNKCWKREPWAKVNSNGPLAVFAIGLIFALIIIPLWYLVASGLTYDIPVWAEIAGFFAAVILIVLLCSLFVKARKKRYKKRIDDLPEASMPKVRFKMK